MIRRLVFGSVTSLAMLAPASMINQVSAHEVCREYRHVRTYRVYYRDPCKPCWVFVGACHHHREAVRLAEGYRCRGFAISIR